MAQEPRARDPEPRSIAERPPAAGRGGDATRAGNGQNGGERAAQEVERAATEAVQQSAEAGREAIRANSEILRSNMETAQQAMQTSVEATVRTFEAFGAGMTRMWGIDRGENTEGTRQSAENVRAVAQAASTLAKGAQDATSEWLRLARQCAKTNMEAFAELASCRSVQDMVAVQSRVMRQNLEQIVQAGQTVAQASQRHFEGATRAFGSEARPGA